MLVFTLVPSLHPLNIHGMFLYSSVSIFFFYVISCKESKCGCTLTKMVVNMFCNPNVVLTLVLHEPHAGALTSFRGVWFMQCAQMVFVC